MKVRPLLIGIDARPLSHPQPGGFKTYVSSLISALADVDDVNKYRLYVDSLPSELPRLGARFEVCVLTSPRINGVGAAWREQVQLPLHVASEPVDVLHYPANTRSLWAPVPTVVTVHDTIDQMPTAIMGAASGGVGVRRQLMRMYNRYSQRIAARKATLVVTPSDTSRRDLTLYLHAPVDRIRVVPNAASAVFRQLPDVDKSTEPYIMAIASADRRKNLVTLLRAYAALPDYLIGRYRLLLVWTHELLQQYLAGETAQLGIAGRIASVVRPSDEELCGLFNRATVFAFPSLYEGFGLPPLEAMACGTAVVAAATSSLPEVLGDAAILVDPTSVRALSNALVDVLDDERRRRDLEARGPLRARRYSWRRTADEMVSAYNEAWQRGGATIVRPARVR